MRRLPREGVFLKPLEPKNSCLQKPHIFLSIDVYNAAHGFMCIRFVLAGGTSYDPAHFAKLTAAVEEKTTEAQRRGEELQIVLLIVCNAQQVKRRSTLWLDG
jgi:hypothetical protein